MRINHDTTGSVYQPTGEFFNCALPAVTDSPRNIILTMAFPVVPGGSVIGSPTNLIYAWEEYLCNWETNISKTKIKQEERQIQLLIYQIRH